MTELKTIKDLIPEDMRTYEFAPIAQGILKQEAIKWVKNFGNEYNNVAKDILKYEFMKFFNITEENLKEKVE